MDAGDLVPDEVLIGIIAERIGSSDAGDGFILDGFPRTMPQAEALDEKIKELGRELTATILIDVPAEEVVRRVGGRRTCKENGHVFHVEFDPPAKEGVCDVCGGELIVRDDDKPEVIKHRLEQYEDKTAPLVDYYEKKGILHRVDGAKDPAEVEQQIQALLATVRREEEI
jgi:adenylate kinase